MDDVAAEKAMLPLDISRQISLKSKAGSFVYSLRRIGLADWRGYFAAMVRQVLHVDGRREEIFESDSALVELVDNVLVSATGYGDLSVVKDWKSALPIKHRIAVGIVLRSVMALPAESSAQLCDLVEISLDATWPTEGKTVMYTGLSHRFRHPSIEQLKRFNFEASRVRVRGDGENGISTYPSRQAIAMNIYDDLIESVDGYSVAGAALEGVENIKREMDGAHKAAAALHLFMGEGEVEIE